MAHIRLAGIAAAIAVLAAACGPSGGSGSADAARSSNGATPVTVEQIAPSPTEEGPSALDGDEGDWTPLIDLSEVLSGGPPPDGIPPLDEPTFLRTEQVDFLEDGEPVISLEVEGESRAYPLQVMTWHEIVNDTIAGVPVAITYCPLCNTAVAFDRRSADRILSFGTSGKLYRSALVMYDRQTESIWTHFIGEAVAGRLTATTLDRFPAAIVSWKTFREANPDALVLSQDTGFDRPYGTNPYPGYDDVDNPPFLFDGEVDGRLAAKERIVGIFQGDDAVAVRLSELSDAGVLPVEVGGRSLVVFHQPGTSSALDSSSVSSGRDVGATGVFVPTAGGRELSFERTADGFRDTQTSTTWNILGEGVKGPLAGEQLERVNAVDTFWFAWAAYRPNTILVP